MAHHMTKEGALWLSVMIELGPHWCKVKLTGIVLLVVLEIGGYKAHYYYNTITHSETKVDGTIIIVLALLYLN